VRGGKAVYWRQLVFGCSFGHIARVRKETMHQCHFRSLQILVFVEQISSPESSELTGLSWAQSISSVEGYRPESRQTERICRQQRRDLTQDR
jgi:hypothetical protein